MLELILTMIIWGTLGAFALWSGVSALEIAFYRSFLGAICIGFFAFKEIPRFSLNRKNLLIAVAGLLIVLNWVLVFKSFQLSSITIGNMSYALQPILLVIFSS